MVWGLPGGSMQGSRQPTDFSRLTPHQVIRTLQIITAALILGVVPFAVVVLVMKQGQVDGQPEVLSWMAAGFAAVAFVVHLVIPNLIARQTVAGITAGEIEGLSDDDRFRKVAPALYSRQIIACALLEGAAFFCGVAYMAEHSLVAIGCMGALLLLLLMKFPTAPSVQFRAENMLREIESRV